MIAALSAPRMARTKASAASSSGTTKAKSRVTDCSAGGAKAGRARPLDARRRNGVEIDLGGDGAGRQPRAAIDADAARRTRRGSSSGPRPSVAERPGCQVGPASMNNCRLCDRRARRLEQRQRLGLGVERGELLRLAALPAARARARRTAAGPPSAARLPRDSGGRPRTGGRWPRRGRGCAARRRSGRAAATGA